MLDAMEEPAPVPGSSSKEIKVKSDALYLANSKTWSETWRRVWGRKIFFVEKFFECPFLGNNFHFFSYRPYFVCLLPVSTVLNRIFYNKKPLFHNKTLLHNTIFCPFVLAAHPITLLLKILGGRMHGPPHPNFLGVGRSPLPPKSLSMLKDV